jgi:hypothetical protein
MSNPRNNPGNNSGNNPGNNSTTPGNNSTTPGNNPGNNSGNNPGNNPGNNSTTPGNNTSLSTLRKILEATQNTEGFMNMNIFGLQINRTCLILMIIYTLIIMYKDDIMKSKIIKNILK